MVTKTNSRMVEAVAQVVNVKDFGAVGDGGTDDTAAIQMALDEVNSKNGGVVYFPEGTYLVSMAKSTHPQCCLIVSANTTVLGAGKNTTTIQRLPSERGVDGVLICNRGYDQAGNGGKYSADGNITFRSIGVTDGAVTPNRGLGDLIGFGNGDGLLVEDCWFGNHDQHAVDISKSRNVRITGCVSENQVNQGASATYQVDAGLIWGIAGSITPSTDVRIDNCIGKDTRATAGYVHFHTQCHAQRVFIHDNNFTCTNQPDNSNVIAGDSNCSYTDVCIYNNMITQTNIKNRCINFPTADDIGNGEIDNLRIYGNTMRGSWRVGIYVGDQSPTRNDFNGPLKRCYIYDNHLNSTLSSQAGNNFFGIYAAGLKWVEVEGNEVIVDQTESQTYNVTFLYTKDNENVDVKNNTLRDINPSSPSGGGRWGIRVNVDTCSSNNLRAVANIRDNYISVRNANYHISFDDPGSSAELWTNLFGTISRNRMIYSPILSNIFELKGLSDGTNNEGFVDFGANSEPNFPFVRSIGSGETISNLALPGSVRSKSGDDRRGNVKFHIDYSPSSLSFEDAEDITVAYLSSTSCVGLMVKDIEAREARFDVVTGNSGVSMIINDTSHQPVIRTSGYFRIKVGI